MASNGGALVEADLESGMEVAELEQEPTEYDSEVLR